jgi:DNA-binding CsgD family transcriptional regulator
MGALAPQRLSNLIGMIYDCAIEPDRWPQTLAEICRTIECISGVILLLDLESSQHRFAYTWGLSSHWAQRYFEYSKVLTGFYARAFSKSMTLDGEPLLISTLMDRIGPSRQIYDDWTEPQSLSEMVQTVVLRQARRLAVFGANRHKSVGVVSEDVLTLIRLLVPHIRRAVAIIDILDVKRIEVRTLAATLDQLAAGVLVIGDQKRILHANSAARGMLSKRNAIASVNGCLSVRDNQADQELANAIRLAGIDEATIGAKGIGVPLRDDASAIAHVLPLARGDLRTRLAPQATAAIFITQPADPAVEDTSAVAADFGLTPAEARILEHLATGATVGEAAKALGISGHTARTHLARIFSKTGVSRQADLIALVNRLVPPVHRPSKR